MIRPVLTAAAAASLVAVAIPVFAQEEAQSVPAVRACQVGYLPVEAKHAMLVGDFPDAAEATVRNSADDVVATVPLGKAMQDANSGDTIRAIDFSDVREPGRAPE